MQKYPWYTYYGIGHAVITLLIVLVLDILYFPLALVGGFLTIIYWIWREAQGPDKADPLHKKLFAYPDRLFDWLLPIVVYLIWFMWR